MHLNDLAAVKLVDYIKKEIDGKYTSINIYIDLSKAFDTLHFDILLHKLYYYGVTSVSFELIRSYLTNRKQYVRFKTYKSDYMDIKSGVPQGSLLGPLLFSIYINDILTVRKKFQCLMYADDTIIYSWKMYLVSCDVLASIIHKLNRTTCGLDPFQLNYWCLIYPLLSILFYVLWIFVSRLVIFQHLASRQSFPLWLKNKV